MATFTSHVKIRVRESNTESSVAIHVPVSYMRGGELVVHIEGEDIPLSLPLKCRSCPIYKQFDGKMPGCAQGFAKELFICPGPFGNKR